MRPQTAGTPVAPSIAAGGRIGRRGRLLLVAGVVVIVARVWARILLNYFRADDFLHLYRLVNFGPRDMILDPFGGHMLIVRNLVMASSFTLFGLHPLPYFAGVLMTHVANAVLVFLLAERATEDPRLAFLGAILFGVAPTHAEALGWYSVYGYVLSCFFTLLALWVLVSSRTDHRPLTFRRALGVAVLTLAASQSFGTGAGVALALPVAALVLRPATMRRPAALAVLCAVPVAVVLAARFLFFRASPLNPDPALPVALFESYFHDLRHIVPMIGHLAWLGATTLLVGAAYPIAHYPDATSTAVLLCLALGSAVFVLRSDRDGRRIMLGLLCVFLATCGAIALGRATISHLARVGGVLEGVRMSPRYYYQIDAIGAVMVTLILREVTRGWADGTTRTALVTGWTVAALTTWTWRTPPVDHYTSQRELVARAERTITEEIARHPSGSVACLSLDSRDDALIVAPKSVFPGYAALFMLLYPTDEADGRWVHFVTSDPTALEARAGGGRIASLLLPAGACPPPP
jgi:hypothetical protein